MNEAYKKQYQTMPAYNGWSNYPTWNVGLWIDNEEWSQKEVERITRTALGVYDLENKLEEYCTEQLPEIPPSFAADIMGWAMEYVNWRELAESYWEDWNGEE